MQPLTIEEQTLAMRVASSLHRQRHIEAAIELADYYKHRHDLKPNDDPARSHHLLLTFLHSLLERGGAKYAASMLWTPNQFTSEPQSVKQLWELFDASDMFLIMGASKMGKSFSIGARLFLEWIRDPEYTSIRVIGPGEDHLEGNLFSHLVSLHKRSSLPMPGEVQNLFIGLDKKEQMSCIRGVVIPKGSVKKAGKLQGGHRRPRPVPHPVFGALSRLFIFIDEIENVPVGVWKDIDNVLSDIEKEGGEGFKIGGAYNPTNQHDEVGKRAEPEFGWNELDKDKHFRWTSKRGWEVLRLDGERSENVVQGRIVYPGLQNRVGLEKIAKNGGGRESPGYYTMGRGMYPPTGIEATVIPSGMLYKMRGEYIWIDEPVPVGATDLALEGGDDAIHTIGKFGRASGIKWPPSIDFPQGRITMFKDKKGRVEPRYGLQVTMQFPLPKAETVGMKNSVLTTNRKAGVRPEYYACDRTGHGAGVADLLKYEWSTAIHDVNYSEGCSTDKLMAEDSKTCAESYDRVNTELWFALRMWAEFNYLLLDPSLDLTMLSQQLTQRRYRSAMGKSKVESKKDYESRGYKSPNEADSLTLLVHAARKGSGMTMSMGSNNAVSSPSADDDDDWQTAMYAGGTRIDPSNQSDFLQEAERGPYPGDSVPDIL
jgi:hypothetical protein